MNFEQICRVENLTRYAIKSAKHFADPADTKSLALAEHILAEVRQAGYFLCDSDCTPDLKQQALRRLGDLFIEGN